MRVLVTGGCGYKGNVLVPKLLKAGHSVIALDLCWFGQDLQPHENLMVVKGDFRKGYEVMWFYKADAVIHLAGIANDPCGELDSKLTWETNVLGTLQLAEAALRNHVKQFIFASSASVYGVKGDQEIAEGEPLFPVSDYNRTKMCAERILLSYADKMAVQIIRPATVCGYSPRFRADTIVNTLTMRALTDGKIHLLSPDLYRPNIHIEDITDLYLFMLDRPHLTGIYNAGFENLQIRAMANLVASIVGLEITEAEGSLDKRSYLVNSDKLLSTGFWPCYKVTDAINDIVSAYRTGKLKDEPRFYNLSHMQKQGLVKT
jgi:nucleoside-diphosphate-sugar epimerase